MQELFFKCKMTNTVGKKFFSSNLHVSLTIAQTSSGLSALLFFLRTHQPQQPNYLLMSAHLVAPNGGHFQKLQSKTFKVQVPLSSTSNSTEILLQWNTFHLNQNIHFLHMEIFYTAIKSGSTIQVPMNNALVKQIPVCRMDWRLKTFQIGNIKKCMKQNLIFVLFFKEITYFSS